MTLVHPADLAAIPLEHRQTIGRWLYERSRMVEPSCLLGAEAADAARGMLAGAAADLVDPESEDTTVAHENAALAELMQSGTEALRRETQAQALAVAWRHVVFQRRAGLAPDLALAEAARELGVKDQMTEYIGRGDGR